jgi:hypothetical protein
VYETQWRVCEGPYAGRTVIRKFWDSATGRDQMNEDCDKLDFANPEELCGPVHRKIVVRGTAAIDRFDLANPRNTLSGFEPVRPKDPAPDRTADSRPDEPRT